MKAGLVISEEEMLREESPKERKLEKAFARLSNTSPQSAKES